MHSDRAKQQRSVKNITLSADEHLVAAARERARSRNTTLDAEFRRWLAGYAATADEGARRGEAYDRLMSSMADLKSRGPYSRNEMNERRDD